MSKHCMRPQYFTSEYDGAGRKASITTVIDAEELKRKKEKATTATPKRYLLQFWTLVCLTVRL